MAASKSVTVYWRRKLEAFAMHAQYLWTAFKHLCG